MIVSKRQVVGLAILFSATVILAVLPFWYIVHTAGDSWQGILPAGYVADSDFYILRMVKGADNFPFGNNPFIIEQAKDSNPALSVADYIGSIPYKAGLSILGSVIFNAIFWNLVFVFLLWLLLRQLGIKSNWSFYLIPVIYFNVYGSMIRPVVAEIVLPFFVFFLLMFLVWLKKFTKLNSFIFAVSIAGTLYIYPYSWQVAFAALAFCFLWMLKNQKWSEAKLLIVIIGGSLVIGFPAVFSIYSITTNPLFPKLLEYVGSIKTHLPSALSFQLGRWIVINSFLWFIAVRFVSKLKDDKNFQFPRVFIMSVGFGILAVLMSPVITGRDGAIGDHVGRELFFWLSISTTTLAYFLFSRNGFYQLKFWKKAAIFLLLVLNFMPVLKHSKRSIIQPFNADEARIVAAQDYAKPIEWLDKYDNSPSVVWADGDISNYIPTHSKFYTLGYIDAIYQYWVNKSEIQERVLLSIYFQEITPEALDNTTLTGNRYMRQFTDLGWKLRVCGVLNFLRFSSKCYPKTSGLTFDELVSQKNEELQNLLEKNNTEVRPYISELLKKYNVNYAIKDLVGGNKNFNIQQFKNAEEIYNDGRFVIYFFSIFKL